MQRDASGLSAIDLFSGCGGLSQGLRDAGFAVIGAVEIHPIAVEAYRSNHPSTKVWTADIREMKGAVIKRHLHLRKGDLDLLAGCPPCQGFSSLRTLNGRRTVEDPRNELLHEFSRLVDTLRPKAILLENVPALKKDERFRLFCDQLASWGYIGDTRILDAADYGVPQRRRRMIYIAGLRLRIQFSDGIPGRVTVRQAFSQLPQADGIADPLHIAASRHSERIRLLIAAIPPDGGSRSDLPVENQLACHLRCDGFHDVYGRMRWDTVSPTITSGCCNPSKGRYIHPEENRVITLREAAVLQGFPVGYHFPTSCSKESIAALIGNALPPPFVAAQARAIMATLGRK